MKLALLVLFGFHFLLAASGKEAKPATQIHHMRVWTVPSELVPRGQDSKPMGRWWLQSQGVKFSASDEINFYSSNEKESENLVAWTEKLETLEQIDRALNFGPRQTEEDNLRVEVNLVEFPADKLPELQGNIPYAKLRKTVGNSWHVLNQMVAMTESGQRAVATCKMGTVENPSAKPPPPAGDEAPSPWNPKPLPPGVLGASLDADPFLNKGSNIIDMNVGYYYRGTGDRVWNTNAILRVELADGVPMIVQIDTKPQGDQGAHPAMLRALVIRVDIQKKAAPETGHHSIGSAADTKATH
jgi:hypothetical protein